MEPSRAFPAWDLPNTPKESGISGIPASTPNCARGDAPRCAPWPGRPAPSRKGTRRPPEGPGLHSRAVGTPGSQGGREAWPCPSGQPFPTQGGSAVLRPQASVCVERGWRPQTLSRAPWEPGGWPSPSSHPRPASASNPVHLSCPSPAQPGLWLPAPFPHALRSASKEHSPSTSCLHKTWPCLGDPSVAPQDCRTALTLGRPRQPPAL